MHEEVPGFKYKAAKINYNCGPILDSRGEVEKLIVVKENEWLVLLETVFLLFPTHFFET